MMVKVLDRAFFVRKGRKGGKKRAENMTPEQRKANAQNAARIRWERRAKKKGESK